MNIEVPAVFENGVLRPLAPLSLADHEQVTVTVKRSKKHEMTPEEEAALAARQREALKRSLAKLDALPDEPPKDNFANDHDRTIYGSIK